MRYCCPAFLLLFFCVVCFSSGFAQTDSTIYNQIVDALSAGKATYAPDKRTRILEISSAAVGTNEYSIQSTEQEAIDFLKARLGKNPARITYTLLPDKSVGDKTYGIVNLSVANLRTQPSHAAEMATQVLLGTQVDILQHKGGDYRVRTPEGYIAWVPTSSITAMDAVELKNWKDARKLIYTVEFGKSYSSPDPTSLRVSDLVYGNILTLLGEEEDGFYKVCYPDGRLAYIAKTEGMSFDQWKASRELSATHLLSSAKSMLGLPYLWGGTSVKGVDCSGFTKTAFYMNGYIIPRDASQQVLTGNAVDILDAQGNFDSQKAIQNLQPGDLLFFAAGKNKRPDARVTHVAMYIGNAEFIHAAGSVRINSFLADRDNYDDFQARTVVAARRYLGAEAPEIQRITDSTYY